MKSSIMVLDEGVRGACLKWSSACFSRLVYRCCSYSYYQYTKKNLKEFWTGSKENPVIVFTWKSDCCGKTFMRKFSAKNGSEIKISWTRKVMFLLIRY